MVPNVFWSRMVELIDEPFEIIERGGRPQKYCVIRLVGAALKLETTR
jgi:hypothetical protein